MKFRLTCKYFIKKLAKIKEKELHFSKKYLNN